MLGVVLHALSLNPAIITVGVIDDVVFDDLFRDLVTLNAEGQVISSLYTQQAAVRGLPFTETTVQWFLDNEPLGGTSAAWSYSKGASSASLLQPAAHLAVAGSLIGEAMHDTTPLEEIAEQTDMAERQRVTTEIAELIGRLPQHAEQLRFLPEILRRPTPS